MSECDLEASIMGRPLGPLGAFAPWGEKIEKLYIMYLEEIDRK
jgi:hypothetical protein